MGISFKINGASHHCCVLLCSALLRRPCAEPARMCWYRLQLCVKSMLQSVPVPRRSSRLSRQRTMLHPQHQALNSSVVKDVLLAAERFRVAEAQARAAEKPLLDAAKAVSKRLNASCEHTGNACVADSNCCSNNCNCHLIVSKVCCA